MAEHAKGEEQVEPWRIKLDPIGARGSVYPGLGQNQMSHFSVSS